ncbi:iron-sulfur protein [Candidatus Woesearchaeota archaeon CG11_big_fil_rev_8_21_14_0_20_43_8]|nr:MAG: iron-sulfur protein [Candidatus Woesearchaeota archaeon CG11_big_fil_rev_8_21_14_0_20_43_8]PIO05100.1 MAG: iron-sulfur protein [Candidatus Woesearchaeota archaeon CG08_land_8_20_14_0_20_43_7]
MTKIMIKRCETYNQKELDKAIEDIFKKLGGVKKYIKKGDKVLLKPNLLMPGKPEHARTTHPNVVLAVAKVVRKAGGKVIVGDSPGIKMARYVAKSNGLLDICKKNKLEFTSFEKAIDTKHLEGKFIKTFPHAEEVTKADVIINLPKVKTHGLTSMTCAVKNNFGCVVGLRKGQYHVKFPGRHEFSTMLLDLYNCVKPDLTIIDGILGMEGKGGPGHGIPVELGFLMAGTDCIAMDIELCNVLGIDPYKVPTNAIAKEKGYIYDKKTEVIGDKITLKKRFDFHETKRKLTEDSPNAFIKWMNNRLTARPIIKDNCIGCADCEKICPAKAITMVEKRSHIDRDKCIKCYCCHEICRYAAIELKKPLLGKILKL